MRLNIAELADMFGVTRPTITAWQGEGMPAVKIGSKGKPWEHDAADCIAWYAENKFRRKRTPIPGSDPFADGDTPESYDEAERRKMVANADKAELELAKSAGLVVPIDEVAFAVAEENARVRAQLLAIPATVRIRVRSFFGGDKKMEEGVVGGVESAILDAMAEIRGAADLNEGDDGND